MHTQTTRLPYTDALPLYRQIKSTNPSCLFESASASDKSSRMSVIGLEPCLGLRGKGELLEVQLLQLRGRIFYDYIKAEFGGFITGEKEDRLTLVIPKLPFYGPEEERLERQNIVQPLRRLLAAFHHGEKNFMGLYGALSYRFVYLFEDIPVNKPCPEPDFHLFLFDNILLFNHLTQDLTFYVTRITADVATRDMKQHLKQLPAPGPAAPALAPLHIGPFAQTPDDETFKRQVQRGIQLCNEGELLEIVLSRKLTAAVQGDLLPLYERYKAINPSPYLFYFDFGDETLLGASPELMLRYENGRATLRPISGSVRRSDNPIEDHNE